MSDPLAPPTSLFLDLSNVDPPAGAALLDARCGGDPELRAEVDAHAGAVEAATTTSSIPTRIPALDPPASTPPAARARLGDFMVFHALGSGGMGVVYAAHRIGRIAPWR